MKKRLVLLGGTLLILVLLWWETGWNELWTVCQHLDPTWFALALAMFVPQTLLSGARWSWIVGAYQPLRVWRATELVLASSALNVVLPSKLGDVAKGAFLRRDLPGGDTATGLTLSVFEKGLDTAALAFCMLIATTFAPPTEALGWLLVACAATGCVAFLAVLSRPIAVRLTRLTHAGRAGVVGKLMRTIGSASGVFLHLHTHPLRLATILLSAIVLWMLHLAQFSFALRAAGGTADTAVLWSRVPMAIFVGLLPVTFAGVGTRDTAMLYFLGPTAGIGVALALGIFATLRYVLVALCGLPFILRFHMDMMSLHSHRPTGAATPVAGSSSVTGNLVQAKR